MFTHKQIWNALDRLAMTYSTSPSGLAKQAGLDPTTFNKSKRQTGNGKDRWPSTESLSKVLSVIGMDFEDFATLAANNPKRGLTVPVIGLAQAGSDGFFDDAGFPVGAGWEDVRVPEMDDRNVYGLEISGDSMAPVLRHGDRILVAPNQPIHRGDRVVVKTLDGEVMAKELRRITPTHIELISLNPDYDDPVIEQSHVHWIGRIVWVSQ